MCGKVRIWVRGMGGSGGLSGVGGAINIETEKEFPTAGTETSGLVHRRGRALCQIRPNVTNCKKEDEEYILTAN